MSEHRETLCSTLFLLCRVVGVDEDNFHFAVDLDVIYDGTGEQIVAWRGHDDIDALGGKGLIAFMVFVIEAQAVVETAILQAGDRDSQGHTQHAPLFG